MNDFHTALFQANLLYGLEMDEDEFEEYGLVAWKQIGNHRVKLYHLDTEVDFTDHSVNLPCNCEMIEAVTTFWEDWNFTSNIKNDGDIDSAFTEEYIEGRKRNQDPLYVRGHFVKYEQVGDKLYFAPDIHHVHILYYGTVADDNGLPLLTDAEVDAIAAFVAYTVTFKKGILTANANLINMANQLRALWAVKCDLARVPEYISQNEMNEILDAKLSWGRKVYNRSYKPIV